MTVLDNVTGTRIKIMSSPAHKSMEQMEEADIMVVAKAGGCCSGIDPSKALERITDSIVKFKIKKGAYGFGSANCECKRRHLLQAKVATGLKWQLIGDLENCGCGCCLHLVGLPEATVGKDPMKWETWLVGYLRIATKTGRIKLDRAHHSFIPKT